jgi:hypothetical protein
MREDQKNTQSTSNEVENLNQLKSGETHEDSGKFPTLTYGQKAVGITFNPGGHAGVDRCKQQFANIIDELAYVRDNSTNPEVKRMISIAITEAQTAQMWAVKAITWKD